MKMWLHVGIFLFLKICSIQVCKGGEPVDIGHVNTKLLELENEILRLKAALCGYEQHAKDIAMLKETSQHNEAAVNELRNELLELSRRPNVAVRGVLSKNLGSVSTGTVIVFDQVKLNIGDAYNHQNGIFTAPYNGTYIFSMSLGNPAGNPGAFFMIHSNGKDRVVLEYTIAGHTTGWNMGGVTTTAELIAGDSIWVEGEGKVHGAYEVDRYHTTFSAVLLH